jgi:hypothetical protein
VLRQTRAEHVDRSELRYVHESDLYCPQSLQVVRLAQRLLGSWLTGVVVKPSQDPRSSAERIRSWNHWHDGADEPHQIAAGGKMAATVEHVSLILQPFRNLQLAKGSAHSTEGEKGMAVVELRHMRTLTAAVRELQCKDTVK